MPRVRFVGLGAQCAIDRSLFDQHSAKMASKPPGDVVINLSEISMEDYVDPTTVHVCIPFLAAVLCGRAVLEDAPHGAGPGIARLCAFLDVDLTLG